MNPIEKSIEVLLVEDDPSDVRTFRDVVKDYLSHWRLSVVSDGEEAMLFLRRQGKYPSASRPDLIIMDLNMPKKDGREVLSEIKADRSLKSIPVVILTTSNCDRDVVAAYELQASSFITKPSERNEVISIIRVLDNYWSKASFFRGCVST